MARLPDLGTGPLQHVSVDPCRYVREADLALLGGMREAAAALVAQAYLAFDIARADCEQLRISGRACPGRNS